MMPLLRRTLVPNQVIQLFLNVMFKNAAIRNVRDALMPYFATIYYFFNSVTYLLFVISPRILNNNNDCMKKHFPALSISPNFYPFSVVPIQVNLLAKK
jgi:hypothetical protein